MDRLKPCPFCGGEAILTRETKGGKDGSLIRYTKCGTKGCWFEKAFGYSSDERAAEAWNRRYEES